MKETQDNIIAIKSKLFALRIIRLYKYLCKQQNEFVLSKQVLRSGTSIGANVREAIRAQSKADFIAKMSISLSRRLRNPSIGWNYSPNRIILGRWKVKVL